MKNLKWKRVRGCQHTTVLGYEIRVYYILENNWELDVRGNWVLENAIKKVLEKNNIETFRTSTEAKKFFENNAEVIFKTYSKEILKQLKG
jgi:hypothetical protein